MKKAILPAFLVFGLCVALAVAQVAEEDDWIELNDCPTPLITVSSPTAKPGDQLIVSASSFVPDTVVTVVVAKKGLPTSPLVVLRHASDANGAVTFAVTIPTSAAPALYSVAAMSPCGSSQIVARKDLTVVTATTTSEQAAVEAVEFSPEQEGVEGEEDEGGMLSLPMFALPVSFTCMLSVGMMDYIQRLFFLFCSCRI